MVIYVFVFIYLAIFSLIELFHVKVSVRTRMLLYWTIAIILIAVAGFRYGLETDYWHYYNIFHGIANPPTFELGFKLLKDIIHRFINNYNIFLIIVAIISMGTKVKIFSKYRYCFVILFCYYLRFYVLFELNTIRQGIAIAFVIVAVYNLIYNKNKEYYIYTFIALMFHTSAICCLFALVLKNKTINMKYIITTYLACLIFRIFLFEQFWRMFSAFIPYVLSSNNSLIHGTQYIINSWDKLLDLDYFSLLRVIVPGICLYFISKDEENKLFMNMYFVGTILNIIFWGLDTISFRIPAVFYVFEGFILNDALMKNKLFGKKKNSLIFTMCFIAIAFCDIWTFCGYLNDSATLVPYQTFFGK